MSGMAQVSLCVALHNTHTRYISAETTDLSSQISFNQEVSQHKVPKQLQPCNTTCNGHSRHQVYGVKQHRYRFISLCMHLLCAGNISLCMQMCGAGIAIHSPR